MASLRARSQFPADRVTLLLSRVLSLFVFLILFSAGWVGLSYLRSVISSRTFKQVTVDNGFKPVAAGAATAQTKPILVYSVSSDDKYYHTAAHIPAQATRSALSEQAARERGLKPCPICMRPH